MRALLAPVSSSTTIWNPAAIGTAMIPRSTRTASERQDADGHGEAGDLGRLSDDRRLPDVVLDPLVDHEDD